MMSIPKDRSRNRRARTVLRLAVAHHAKPGMGAEFWSERKAIAEERMSAIDASPMEWRELVYEFGLEPVVRLARLGLMDAQRARAMLERGVA